MSTNEVVPHYTRYQPQPCREDNPDWALPRCQAPMENSFIDENSFVWNNEQSWIDQLKPFQFDFAPHMIWKERDDAWDYSKELTKFHDGRFLNTGVEEPPVCLIGDSHSQHIWRAMHRLNLAHQFALSCKH
jgi:hypothetical protein